MTAPGFSVTELLQAISKCRDIYENFNDEYANAPARIQELVDTCKYLHDVLQDFKSVLGDGYPQQSAFAHKLRECEAFINKYRHLKKEFLLTERSTRSTEVVREKWKRTWETTKYELDKKKATDLKDALSFEIQKLVLFILVFALKRNAPAPALVASDYGDPLGVMPSHGMTAFQRLFIQLQSIRYKYEREMSMLAQQSNRQPNLIGLYNQLDSVWQELCDHAGLSSTHQPRLPLSMDRLLTTPSRNMNDMMINLSRPLVHSGFGPLPSVAETPMLEEELPSVHHPSVSPSLSPTLSQASFRISPSSTFSIGPASSISNPTSPLRPTRSGLSGRPPSSINLPSASLLPYVATIPSKIRLRDWRLDRTEYHNRIIWTGENPPVPRGSFPDTLHSDHTQNHPIMAMQIFFSGTSRHDLHWTGEDGVSNHWNVAPKYIFTDFESRTRFQGDVRDKDLVKTFDTDIIWTDINKRENEGVAILQDLKIWKDRFSPCHYSLSFVATSVEKGHTEYYLSHFDKVSRRDPKNPRQIFLDFTGRKKSISPSTGSPLMKRRSTLNAFTTVFKSKGSSYSRRESLENGGNSSEQDISKSPRYLAIEFSSLGHLGHLTASQAAKDFLEIFNSLQAKESSITFSGPFELGHSGASPSSHRSDLSLGPSPRQQPTELQSTPEPVELPASVINPHGLNDSSILSENEAAPSPILKQAITPSDLLFMNYDKANSYSLGSRVLRSSH